MRSHVSFALMCLLLRSPDSALQICSQKGPILKLYRLMTNNEAPKA